MSTRSAIPPKQLARVIDFAKAKRRIEDRKRQSIYAAIIDRAAHLRHDNKKKPR